MGYKTIMKENRTDQGVTHPGQWMPVQIVDDHCPGRDARRPLDKVDDFFICHVVTNHRGGHHIKTVWRRLEFLLFRSFK